MKKKATLFIVGFLTILAVTAAYSWDDSTPLVIDHTCTDLSQIPDKWIDSVQANLRMYYVHTSHGRQIVCGLERIESIIDPKFNVNIGNGYLPIEEGALCVYDRIGSTVDYWFGNEWQNGMDITRQVLNDNPAINISMFMWCIELYNSSQEYVQKYLDSISTLEREFPEVNFIYTTSNAEYCYDPNWDLYGYTRYLRNEQIRQYCRDNNKILFDFADLDSWWFNPSTNEWEHATCVTQDHIIPIQHHKYGLPDDCGHANWECCEQKAKALWWMLARLAGWEGTSRTSRLDIDRAIKKHKEGQADDAEVEELIERYYRGE